MRSIVLSFVLAVAVAGAAAAQTTAQPGDPLSAATKSTYDQVRGYIIKSAEKMAEADYSFKPSPDVRSFGALLGHIANANFMICSRLTGEKSPAADDFEKTKTAKADLVKAVTDSFAYCDKLYGSMTDAKGMELIDFFRQKQPRIAALAFNTAHNYEHYGNLVTYMRIKGLVPPSSERSSQ